MIDIKCPECGGKLRGRLDGFRYVELKNKIKLLHASVYIDCEECSFAEDTLFLVPENKIPAIDED